MTQNLSLDNLKLLKKFMKRILFVITQSEFGGAQRFLYELTTRLNKERYEILVASNSEKKSDFLNSLGQKGIKTKRLTFLKRNVNPFYDFLALIQLIILINRFKPDFLHLNSSKSGVLGSIAGFMIKSLKFSAKGGSATGGKNLKIIYRIGGWSFNDPGPLWKKKIFILAEKITAGFKNVIVVNNQSDFEQAVKLKIKPKKELKLIYNGIDALKTDFLPKDEARLELGISQAPLLKVTGQADFIIGTIANFYPTKGLEYLVEAIRFLNFQFSIFNFQLVLIGDGIERPKIEELIKKYKLGNSIILAGQIPEARKFMKAFDIFVLPSVKEGFPWSVLDAMAAKLPVVTTDVGALPEIIENNKNGILVEPKNPQQLAEAIRYLLENERVRQEFSLQAHQTVLFKFQIEKMVRETEELFSDENHN
ncbi:MAG: group 1 glycosyl transferase [Parcubacteria group bacterium Gr01-1014_2]|nr:MAG: group 1 glycosyl transferase [Parcubacteria group bacterium Gr01-1014_2]